MTVLYLKTDHILLLYYDCHMHSNTCISGVFPRIVSILDIHSFMGLILKAPSKKCI